MELLERCQEVDQSAMLVHKDKEYQQGVEIPAGEEFIKTFAVYGTRNGRVGIHTTISTKRSLGELKWANDRKLMKWLISAGLYVETDRWKTKRSKKIGSVLNVHPTLVWKDDLKLNIQRGLEDTECIIERTKWQAARGRKDLIPEFKLINENKSFGAEANRVTAPVISIETAEADAEYMMHLMREADEKGKIRGTFIESGYHLSATPKRLIISLNNQNHFLNNIRAITVVGIKEEIMNKRIEVDGKYKVMREYLIEKFQLGGIERTSQTGNLGKWYFLTTQ